MKCSGLCFLVFINITISSHKFSRRAPRAPDLGLLCRHISGLRCDGGSGCPPPPVSRWISTPSKHQSTSPRPHLPPVRRPLLSAALEHGSVLCRTSPRRLPIQTISRAAADTRHSCWPTQTRRASGAAAARSGAAAARSRLCLCLVRCSAAGRSEKSPDQRLAPPVAASPRSPAPPPQISVSPEKSAPTNHIRPILA